MANHSWQDRSEEEPSRGTPLAALLGHLVAEPQMVTIDANLTRCVLPASLNSDQYPSGSTISISTDATIQGVLKPGQTGMALFLDSGFAPESNEQCIARLMRILAPIRAKLGSKEIAITAVNLPSGIGNATRVALVTDTEGNDMSIEQMAEMIQQTLDGHALPQEDVKPKPNSIKTMLESAERGSTQFIREIAQHVLDPINSTRINEFGLATMNFPPKWKRDHPGTINAAMRHTDDRRNKAFELGFRSTDLDTKQALVLWLDSAVFGDDAKAAQIPLEKIEKLRQQLDDFVLGLAGKHQIEPLEYKLTFLEPTLARTVGYQSRCGVVIATTPSNAKYLDRVKETIRAERQAPQVIAENKSAPAEPPTASPLPVVQGQKLITHQPLATLTEAEKAVLHPLLTPEEDPDVHLMSIASQMVAPSRLRDIGPDHLLRVRTPKRPYDRTMQHHEVPFVGQETFTIDTTQALRANDDGKTNYLPTKALVLWLHPAHRLKEQELNNPELAANEEPTPEKPLEAAAVDFAEEEKLRFFEVLEDIFTTAIPYTEHHPAKEFDQRHLSTGGSRPSALVLYATTPEQEAILDDIGETLDLLYTQAHVPDPLSQRSARDKASRLR